MNTKKQFSMNKSKTERPLWFLFPGLGGQWPAMAKASCQSRYSPIK